jgi:toxin ParE1/3/4
MAEVVWRPDALDDLIEIAAYIRQFNPDAAESITSALRALGESLCVFPNRGRPAAKGTREMTTVPPYVLAYRYRVAEDEVDILSIRHGRRQPRT